MLHFRTLDTRFHLATEARNTIQEAALNVQTAQAMLPVVQFPYCTTREIIAVLQVSTATDVGYTWCIQVLRSPNFFSGMYAGRNVKVVGDDVAVL